MWSGICNKLGVIAGSANDDDDDSDYGGGGS